MIKRVTKQRVVEYAENDIICDLCEATVVPGTPMITLTPQIAEADGGRFVGDHKIEVCSVECLTKNVGAAGLVFNTNVFQELRTKKRERDNTRNEQSDMLKEYSKAQEIEKYRQFGIGPSNSNWGKITSGGLSGNSSYTAAVAKPYKNMNAASDTEHKDMESF